MGILTRLIDKVLFAVLFIVTLQVPVLNQQYLQYLNGYLDATGEEIAHYARLANDHGYSSVNVMIEALLNNETALVRDDAQHKLAVIEAYNEAQFASQYLQQANYFEQVGYFVQPNQYPRLQSVINVFEPSLPLQPESVGSALVTALVIYLFPWTGVALIRRRQRAKQRHFV